MKFNVNTLNEPIKRYLKNYTALVMCSWILHCILLSCARHYLTVYLKDSKMFFFVLTLWFNAALLLYACPSRGTAGFYFVQNRNMVAGHALKGFTYKDVTTADAMSCFHRCSSECRCISFNIHATNNTLNCQLNEENRNTKPHALVASPEFNHYDLVIDYPSEVKYIFFLIFIWHSFCTFFFSRWSCTSN